MKKEKKKEEKVREDKKKTNTVKERYEGACDGRGARLAVS